MTANKRPASHEPSALKAWAMIREAELHLGKGRGFAAGMVVVQLAERCSHSVELLEDHVITDAAISLCAQFADRFDGASDIVMRRLVASALGKRGWMLATPGRHLEIGANSDRIIALFEHDLDPPIRAQVALARVNRLLNREPSTPRGTRPMLRVVQ